MRVAIVGNGPNASGFASLIDACDFVVRMKAFWRHGAKDTGDKFNAWATFGGEDDLPRVPSEIWVTQCPELFLRGQQSGERFENIAAYSAFAPMRWIGTERWNRLKHFLSAGPSTGFVALDMALRLFPKCELNLFGFDSTTKDAPNWEDATPFPGGNVSRHPFLREKQTIAAISRGRWLGMITEATLAWHNRPEFQECGCG